MHFPDKEQSDYPPSVEKLVHAGDELLKRAKEISQECEERVRKSLGQGDTTPAGAFPADDEVPPV